MKQEELIEFTKVIDQAQFDKLTSTTEPFDYEWQKVNAHQYTDKKTNELTRAYIIKLKVFF